MTNHNTKTHRVYCLFNIVTNQQYIGMTSLTLKRRMIQHLSDLRKNRHSSTAMQYDYNNHGESSFRITLIEGGLDLESAYDQEQFYIDTYGTVKHGYNTVKGYNIRFVWNGVEYPSLKSAAMELGVGIGTIYYRMEHGYVCDDDMPRPNKSQPITWNNIEYPSINAAAKACGISFPSMRKRIDKGYTCDADLKKSFVWEGVEYESKADASRRLGIPYWEIVKLSSE